MYSHDYLVYSQTDPWGQGDRGDLMDQLDPDIKHKRNKTVRLRGDETAGGNNNKINIVFDFFTGCDENKKNLEYRHPYSLKMS